MHTIEIDDETYAGLEALAKQERASVSSVVKRALCRLPSLRKPAPVKIPHEYKIPVSEVRKTFTTAEVLKAERNFIVKARHDLDA